MDKDWFKTRLRKSGKTAGDLADAISRDRSVVSRIMNGHQAPTIEQAKVFADELGVDVADMLVRVGLADAPTAKNFTPGFAESDAVPWIPNLNAASPDERRLSLISTPFGVRPGVDVMRVRSEAMVLAGYLPGDYIVLDTFAAERVKPGDVVIAQVYDHQGGAKTVLRRFQPPVIIPCCLPNAGEQVYVVDNYNVLIRGKVTACWRLNET